MSKKFGKFLLFSAIAGAAAYGAYSYLQKKQQPVSAGAEDDTDEDFDDFSEELDEDFNSGKDRSYVSLNLDKAEALASEAFHKAKEVITDSVQQVKETVKSVADSQGYHSSFTDLAQTAKSAVTVTPSPASTDTPAKEEETSASSIDVPSEAQDTVSAGDTNHSAADKTPAYRAENADGETVEEFFDDDDNSLDAM